MIIRSIAIRHFKSIESLVIKEIEKTMILVGPNNVGKSAVLTAIKLLSGQYDPSPFDFNGNHSIEVEVTMDIEEEDLNRFHNRRLVSKFNDYDKWLRDFESKVPTYADGTLLVGCKVTPEGNRRYSDGVIKDNPYIKELIPSLYIINEQRHLSHLHEELLQIEQKEEVEIIRRDGCIFDANKTCNNCFICIGMINKKKPEDLTLHESLLLVRYKLFSHNLKSYTDRVNHYFKQNYGQEHVIQYHYAFDFEKLLNIKTEVRNLSNGHATEIEKVTNSFKSLYILSLLQAYIEMEEKSSTIIMVELPELYLHPRLQKVTSEILYRLSKKNQVFFSTHSPHLVQNFNEEQIRQIGLDDKHHTIVIHPTDIDRILDDLGQDAGDFMNVNFVFIVEGKDDRSRLPLLLKKYYQGVVDEQGQVIRIAIIPTNSCTNIRTYANLKFINKTYLKDHFLIIRDSDGQEPASLKAELCHYYDQRRQYDDAKIPRIQEENVLVLKYYAIENYFLDPTILVKLGVIEDVESFYEILYSKYRQYLYKLRSTKKMVQKTGLWFNSPAEMIPHMETIKTYIRGHNLFDIFYGRYKKEDQQDLLERYIELAPREAFLDILEAIDRFVYFENRRKKD